MAPTHRIMAYHQSHGHGDSFVSLAGIGNEAPVTHLLVAALHIESDGTISVNDHPHDDPWHDQLWADVAKVRERGVKVMVMVGGWAPGTTEKLDGDAFDTYYPPLRDMLREHRLDGVDIDVEQDMSLEGVIRLIDALRADFGPGFTIVLAPVASAMWGGENLSGFDYRELERLRGHAIDWYLVQFYSGYARADDIDAYERVLAAGFAPDRVLLGMIGASEDRSFIPLEGVADTVEEIAARYPDFAGVDIWEFPVRDGKADPTWWATTMQDAMDRGRARAEKRPEPMSLVPRPREMQVGDGRTVLPARLVADGPDEWLAAAADLLRPGTGISLTSGQDSLVRLVVSDELTGEAYELDVDDDGVCIAAGDLAGLINGVLTLRQLLPDWAHGPAPLPGAELVVPHVHIKDAPRYRWRGMHLDVGRHFRPLHFLYKFVDLLALHKLNVLHLHLTEDQGWRFEVKSWPRLTTTGAWRPETRFPHWETGDGTPHGGWYTQDQLRALVAYARTRGVTIVPEVDVPGHVRALLAAYPQFGDGSGERGVATTFGVFDEVLHLDDAAMAMVEDVFSELLDVFDSEIIHIGGDETPRTQWHNNPDAAALAEARGLSGVDELQRWFTARLRDFLAARGRRVIGWDEIADDGGIDDAIVMSWRGSDPGRRALADGNEVVMSPWQPTYFDHYQSKSDREPQAIGGHTPWQHVIALDPSAGVPDEQLDRLLGVQGQLWSEYFVSAELLEYMAFPRASALAEVAWNGPGDAAGFEPALRAHLRRLDAGGVNYRPLDGPHPWQTGGTGRYARKDDHDLGYA